MAALTITAANVGLSTESGASTSAVQFGEAITQGQAVYQNTSDNKYYKTDADDTVAKSLCAGIALTKGDADDYGVICTDGDMDLGATLTIGETYALDGGGTTGAIAPVADLATGDWVTILGVAITASRIHLDIYASQIQRA